MLTFLQSFYIKSASLTLHKLSPFLRGRCTLLENTRVNVDILLDAAATLQRY